MNKLADHPTADDYRILIKRAWEDIHHSRNQEWRALVAISGAHLAIFQVTQLGLPGGDPEVRLSLVGLGGLLALLTATVGILMTYRSQRLMKVKLSWIYKAEWALGLVCEKTEEQLEDELKKGTDEWFGASGIVPRRPEFEKHLKWDGLERPRAKSTGALILSLYLLLVVLDLLAPVALFKAFN